MTDELISNEVISSRRNRHNSFLSIMQKDVIFQLTSQRIELAYDSKEE
jgi:hypothetical protein